MPSIQETFEHLIVLSGKEVEVGISSSKIFRGRISNVMFDSFLLESQGKPLVIRFEDILFLRELPENSTKNLLFGQ